jgi:hypothetical protein
LSFIKSEFALNVRKNNIFSIMNVQEEEIF